MEATRFANYPGDVTAAIDKQIVAHVPMGPTTAGEAMWPVSAVYNPETKKTRVGFSFIEPPVHI